MNTTLAPLLRKGCVSFFDDILIYSQSYEEHLEHIRLVLQLLQKDQWQVKMTKCSFAQRQLRYLGHIISEAGVATDPDKIQAVLQWPSPTSVRDLWSFLCLAGYYRRFVKHFGIISRPLTELLRKGAVFVWTDVQEQAFVTLSEASLNICVCFSSSRLWQALCCGDRRQWLWYWCCTHAERSPIGIFEQGSWSPIQRVIHLRERIHGNTYGIGALA